MADKQSDVDDNQHDTDSSSSSSDELGEIDRYWPAPTSQKVEIAASPRAKTVSALAVNHAGTRFATGGHDHDIRLWDFQALDLQQPMPIHCSQPCGQSIIRNLDFSRNDELILVISGTCQATILGKDGLASKEYLCPKGDQYIRDMTNTKGHVQMLNDGNWSPKDQENFLTCSNDGTVRIWNINKLSQQSNVIKTRSPVTGLKANPSVCKYSRDALLIAAGCTDGSIMFWDTRRKFLSTSICIRGAHLKGSEVVGIDYAYGYSTWVCTRSEDETCKLWDTRQTKQPLGSRSNLPTNHSGMDCSFSPDDRFIMTGLSASKSDAGCLLLLDSFKEDLETKESLGEQRENSVIRSRWHPKINHLFYTYSSGSMQVSCDPERSQNGLIDSSSVVSSKRRKKYISQNDVVVKKIMTPHALPLFRDDQPTLSKSRQACRPELPGPNANQGGLVRAAGSTLSSYVARQLAKPKGDKPSGDKPD